SQHSRLVGRESSQAQVFKSSVPGLKPSLCQRYLFGSLSSKFLAGSKLVLDPCFIHLNIYLVANLSVQIQTALHGRIHYSDIGPSYGATSTYTYPYSRRNLPYPCGASSELK